MDINLTASIHLAPFLAQAGNCREELLKIHQKILGHSSIDKAGDSANLRLSYATLGVGFNHGVYW